MNMTADHDRLLMLVLGLSIRGSDRQTGTVFLRLVLHACGKAQQLFFRLDPRIAGILRQSPLRRFYIPEVVRLSRDFGSVLLS